MLKKKEHILYLQHRAWGTCYILEESSSKKDLEVTTNKQLNKNTQCNVVKMAKHNPWRHKQEVVGRLGKAFLLFFVVLFSEGIFNWVKKGITRTKVWNAKPRKKEKVKSNQKRIPHFETARELAIGTKLPMEGRSFNLLMASRWRDAVCARNRVQVRNGWSNITTCDTECQSKWSNGPFWPQTIWEEVSDYIFLCNLQIDRSSFWATLTNSPLTEGSVYTQHHTISCAGSEDFLKKIK